MRTPALFPRRRPGRRRVLLPPPPPPPPPPPLHLHPPSWGRHVTSRRRLGGWRPPPRSVPGRRLPSSTVASAVASTAVAQELGATNLTAREAVTLGRQGAELARELGVTPGQALGAAAQGARLAKELGVAPDQALNAGVGAARLFAAVTREATPRRWRRRVSALRKTTMSFRLPIALLFSYQ